MHKKKYLKAICDSVTDLRMFRGDSNDAAFARHLVQETLSELFKMEYTQTKWASGELLPINTSVNEGVREYSYFDLGKVGQAKLVSDNATDIPTATIRGSFTATAATGATQHSQPRSTSCLRPRWASCVRASAGSHRSLLSQ